MLAWNSTKLCIVKESSIKFSNSHYRELGPHLAMLKFLSSFPSVVQFPRQSPSHQDPAIPSRRPPSQTSCEPTIPSIISLYPVQLEIRLRKRKMPSAQPNIGTSRLGLQSEGDSGLLPCRAPGVFVPVYASPIFFLPPTSAPASSFLS